MEPIKNKIKNKKNSNNIKNLPIDTQIYLKNNASITEYNYYKNQNEKLLPITSIIDYMAKNFNTFYEKFKKKRTDGGFGETIILNDIFVIPPIETVPDQNGNFSFTSKFVENPDIPFDYFISLLDWNLSNSKKKNYNEQNINKLGISESIKDQAGKDIFRLPTIINNVAYKGTDNFDKYQNTDIFNETIMQVMNNAGILIDLNNINIIDIFMQQNIGNFLSMAISLFASKLIPGNEIIDENGDLKYLFLSRNFQEDKPMKKEFILNKQKQNILISGETELFLEGECPGNFSFILNIDLKNKKYYLDNLTINFNVDDCIPEQNSANVNNVQQSESYLKKGTKFISNNKGIIAAGLATSGLISVGALYLAGVLGGKKSKNYKTKNYKTKNYKTKNYKTKKYKTKKYKTKKYRI
jgi:hypothetical protein